MVFARNVEIVEADISVLLCTVAGDDCTKLRDAIHSVSTRQTVSPAELVIVKDGPLGDSLNEALRDFETSLHIPVRVVQMPRNQGLGRALNAGLRVCSSTYVARMDADDESLPLRFEKQISFFKQNPNIDVLGTWIEEVDHEQGTSVIRRVPLSHEEIEKFAKRRNPISHPSVMFRKAVVSDVGGYPPFSKWQDYGLWARLLMDGARFANLSEILVRMSGGSALMARRGLRYFGGEARVLTFQWRSGFLSFPEYSRNLLARCLLRASPSRLRAELYKRARG